MNNPNHITLNLITKGILNMSNITKGMILIGYKIIIRRRTHGGSGDYVSLPYGKKDEPLFKEYKDPKELYDDIKETEDIDYIEVQVQWDKSISDKNKKIKVELIKKRIEAVIFQETGKNIKVDIL